MKYIALLLTGVFTLSFLAGCARRPAQTAPSTSTTQVPVTIQVSPTTTAPPPTTQALTTPPATKLTDWFGLDGKWYYYTEDSVMVTGWLTLEEKRYYFTEDGSMAVGIHEIQGETCYFGSDGVQLVMCNPWNPIPDWYEPDPVTYMDWHQGDSSCYEPLMALLQACREAGYKPCIGSGYRDHAFQTQLYERKIQRLMEEGYSAEEATRLAGTVVAVPGTSEHELGLAFDLVDEDYQILDDTQETLPTQQWLMANSWRYGFILRYPNNKSDITGIIYEPWHYRYVGATVAKEIYESGMCLEEYLASLNEK